MYYIVNVMPTCYDVMAIFGRLLHRLGHIYQYFVLGAASIEFVSHGCYVARPFKQGAILVWTATLCLFVCEGSVDCLFVRQGSGELFAQQVSSSIGKICSAMSGETLLQQ